MPEVCVALVRALTEKRKPTSRQVGALYAALVSGSDEARSLVLRDPWLFLRAQTEAQRAKEKERTPAEVLLGDFGALSGIAGRARKRLGEIADRLSPGERDEVVRAMAFARIETSSLFLRGDKEFTNAGSTAANHDPKAS